MCSCGIGCSTNGPIDLFDALLFDRLDRVPDVLARDLGALERAWAQVVTRPAKPDDDVTPLMRMAELGKAAAVRVLIAAGADTSVRM